MPQQLQVVPEQLQQNPELQGCLEEEPLQPHAPELGFLEDQSFQPQQNLELGWPEEIPNWDLEKAAVTFGCNPVLLMTLACYNQGPRSTPPCAALLPVPAPFP